MMTSKPLLLTMTPELHADNFCLQGGMPSLPLETLIQS